MALFKKKNEIDELLEEAEKQKDNNDLTVEEETYIEELMAENPEVFELTEDNYGGFYKYVMNDLITDVDFNGEQLWLTYTDGRREVVENHGITTRFIEAFSQRVANKVSKPFNKMENLLEAETETLRISILHESAATSGRSVCLRKTPITARMTAKSIVESSYLDEKVLNLLVNCLVSHMNFSICGEPGAGKTELAKFLSQFISLEERVITIEDSPEWHYKKLNPGHDCVEMRINEEFDYAKAIKTSLRQNPKWIMLSEARSVEAKYLIESWSTGVNGLTTLHTDDVRKIPSRYLNMMATREDADRLENDIYEFCNVGILVRRKKKSDGTAYRYVDQVGFLTKEKKIELIVKNGKLVDNYEEILPQFVKEKLTRSGVEDFFANAQIKERL